MVQKSNFSFKSEIFETDSITDTIVGMASQEQYSRYYSRSVFPSVIVPTYYRNPPSSSLPYRDTTHQVSLLPSITAPINYRNPPLPSYRTTISPYPQTTVTLPPIHRTAISTSVCWAEKRSDTGKKWSAAPFGVTNCKVTYLIYFEEHILFLSKSLIDCREQLTEQSFRDDHYSLKAKRAKELIH